MSLSLGVQLGLTNRQWRRFSLTKFMGDQADGFYYDFTQTDRHFQEHTGPTLADDTGEVIGLALDQRTWNGASLSAALGPELVPDSTLSDVAALTLQTDWSASAGVVTKVGGASGRFVSVTGSLATVGATYYSTTVVSARSAGTMLVNIGSVDGVGRTAAGTYTEYVRATTSKAPSPDGLTFFGNSAFAGSVDSWSVKLVPGYSALQSTGTMKPTRQTSGAKFDGSDDNLLTTYYAGASIFIVALVTVPATLAADQIICGASEVGANRGYFMIRTTGVVAGGVGAQSFSTIQGTTDVRGQRLVIGMNVSATTVTLYVDDAIEYSASRNGNPSTTVPWRIGAHNYAGTAASFFAGSVEKLVAGSEDLVYQKYLKVKAALLA